MTSKLNPYLHLDGTTAEAMAFYQGIFGGELTRSTFAEGGMPHGPEDAAKIMHAQLDTPTGMTLMASDTPSGWPVAPISGVSISLSGENAAELTGYWDGLAAGGTIAQPLVQAPWGDTFGMLTDRFGVAWMVNIAGPAASTARRGWG